jgi:N,N'-diacetyllegionaminate synthase
VITLEMLGIKKPGSGIPAARLNEVVGSVAKVDIKSDSLIRETDLVARAA